MKRSELKQIIKECIVELFIDGASSNAKLTESLNNRQQLQQLSQPQSRNLIQKQTLQQHAGVKKQQEQRTVVVEKKKSPLDERVVPFSQRMASLSKNNKNNSSVNVLDDIMNDTLNSTLREQAEHESSNQQDVINFNNLGVYEDEIAVPDGGDQADYFASKIDPTSMQLDDKWSKLAFQS